MLTYASAFVDKEKPENINPRTMQTDDSHKCSTANNAIKETIKRESSVSVSSKRTHSDDACDGSQTETLQICACSSVTDCN